MTIECPKCRTDNPDDSKFCKECATPLPTSVGISQTKTLETPTDKLSPGNTIGDRYQIIKELGKGGMGRVYKVQDTQINEEIALKTLKPEIALDESIIERFRNELKIARKITHKNVCRTYDINEVDGTPFITMELVKGESLKQYILRKDKLSEKKAIATAKLVCEGLIEAHELGIVHRDLKPQNIMIDEKGNVKIMDFGIARSVEIKGMTQSGVMIGTPEYISPEQAEGDDVDSRTDIYSLGVVLYEMVTGTTPFKGETALSVALKHKTKLPQDPQKLNPKISKDLARLILVCLEKEKERRYQTAEELLSDLRNIEEGFPLGTKIRPRSKADFSILIRKKFFIPAIILALVVLAVGIWLLVPKGDVGPKSLSRKPTLAIVYFRNSTNVSEIDRWRTTFPEYLMDDIGQSKLINVLNITKIYSILQELNILESDIYSEADLKKICEIGSASHILTGQLLKSENNFKTNVILYRADTLEILGTDEVEGNIKDDWISMVNRLTLKIKNLFGLSEALVADDIDMSIGEFRPESVEAYELYSEGQKAAFIEADYDRAIDLIKEALKIESDFGYGYLALSQIYFNSGKSLESKHYAEIASKYEYNMAFKEMKIAQARLNAYSEKTLNRCFELSNEVLEYYPDNLDANDAIAFFSYTLENWNESISYYTNVWKSGFRDSWYPYSNLSKSYSAKGLYAEAEQCLHFAMENVFPEHPAVYGGMALVNICQGDFSLAQKNVEKALSLPDKGAASHYKGILLYCREDFSGAEEAFEEQKKSLDPWGATDAFMQLHNTCIAQGRFGESESYLRNGIVTAEKENQSMYCPEFYFGWMYNLIKSGRASESRVIFNSGWEKATKAGVLDGYYTRRLLYIKGMAELEMGNLQEAKSTAISLKELIEFGLNPKEMRLYFHLSGQIADRAGNTAEAREMYQQALELIPYEHADDFFYRVDMAPYRESLGLNYFKMEELDKAITEFEKIQYLTIGRLCYGDIYAKSYLTLGQIYEQKGWEGKAIDSYEMFLELWKNADPGLPEVEDTKKRLAALKTSLNKQKTAYPQ